jgi:putative Holliday junction resolvase
MRDETLLAFDFGMKRIGVAVGELRLGSARALQTISAEANDQRFSVIEKLIAEWQPTRLLVGQPLNDDGSPHEMTARCERFANQLRGRFSLPVEHVDERFSSVEADLELRNPDATPSRQQGGRQAGSGPQRLRRLSWQERKAKVDAEAARIILQSWMETQTHG